MQQSNLFSAIEVTLNGSKAPDGFSVDLLGATIENSLHLPDMATLVLSDQKLSWVDDDRLTPGKSLQILFSTGKLKQNVFDGEIVEIEPSFDQEIKRLTIRAFDRMHRLARVQQARSFMNVSDGDLVNKLAGEVQLTAQVDPTPEVYPYVFQQNETNLAFLQKRAAALGYLLYVQGHTLHCKAPRSSQPAITLEWGATLNEFHPRLTTVEQIETLEARGWDPDQKQAIVGSANAREGIGLAATGQGGNGGSLVQSAFHMTTRLLIADRPVRTQERADQLARAAANRQAGRFIEAEGQCYGNPQLVAGVPVAITKVGQRFGGTYFVSSTIHTYGIEGYTTSFTASGLHPSTLISTLARKEEQSAFSGLVIALVTDNQDPQGYGRVKVKYPWLAENQASDWARVIAPGGGNNRGIEFLPEVNDEVLVGFELGDIHYPYVLGGLWNGKDALPERVASNGSIQKRLIRSRAGHTITLDDNDAGGGITLEDKNGNKVMLDSASNKLSITVRGDASIESQGNLALQAQGNLTLQATGQVQLKGNGATVDGGAGNTDVKGLNVNIKGIMINLN
jgi:phage protein D